MKTLSPNMVTAVIAAVTTVVAAGITSAAHAQDLTSSGMFYPIVSTKAKVTAPDRYLGWLGRNPNFNNQVHLGVDVKTPAGSPVYAVSEGTVVASSGNISSYGGDNLAGGGMVICHRTGSGTLFYALYAHLSERLPVGTMVKGGQRIAAVGNYWSGRNNIPHLHFGICSPNSDPNPWRGYASAVVYGWTNPVAFIENNAPSRNRFTQWDDLDFAREENNPMVYVMVGGARLHVRSMEGFSWDRVRLMQPGSLSGMTTVPRGGTMFRNVFRPEVWVILPFYGAPYRWWIRTESRVNQFGGWGAVRVIPDVDFSHIPDSGISLW